MEKKPRFAFFGTPEIAVTALSETEHSGYLPSLVVCNPDAPVGRKQILTPPPTKVWAQSKQIPVFQPTTLKKRDELSVLTEGEFDFFVVFAYGKILPEWLLELPKYGTINGHPSLLPKLRGASPIRSALLSDLDAVGVTIIKMDAQLDHGPILAQEKVPLLSPIPGRELDDSLAHIVGRLLCEVMDQMQSGTLTETAQNDADATFCGKITKEMGELQIDPHALPTGSVAYEMYRKICAFDGWPGTFFMHSNKRVKIINARLENNTLILERVVPEGKKEMNVTDYLRSLA